MANSSSSSRHKHLRCQGWISLWDKSVREDALQFANQNAAARRRPRKRTLQSNHLSLKLNKLSLTSPFLMRSTWTSSTRSNCKSSCSSSKLWCNNKPCSKTASSNRINCRFSNPCNHVTRLNRAVPVNKIRHAVQVPTAKLGNREPRKFTWTQIIIWTQLRCKMSVGLSSQQERANLTRQRRIRINAKALKKRAKAVSQAKVVQWWWTISSLL